MKDKCMQEKCQFNRENPELSGVAKEFMVALCPVCASCNCESNVVDDECDNCRLCENREGYIRKGQPKPLAEIVIKQKDDMEVTRDLLIRENNKLIGGMKDDRHTTNN